MMNRSLICCSAFLLLIGAQAAAQLPDTCKPPTSATQRAGRHAASKGV